MEFAKPTRLIALSAALSLLPASAGTQERAGAIAISGRANAYASLAASGSFAVLAWGARTNEGVTDIYLAVSRDSGRSFGAPVRVNKAADTASLSGEQPPRVALVPRQSHEPSIVVVWTAKASAGTRILTARSDDGGKTFASSAIGGAEAAGNRGWESIATDRHGDVVALWLDHRELAPAQAGGAGAMHGEHHHETGEPQTDGAARAQLSKLFFSRIGTPSRARALTGGVCYCCRTALATASDGTIYAAWRHVYPGNVRDIAFSVSRDGLGSFLKYKTVTSENNVYSVD